MNLSGLKTGKQVSRVLVTGLLLILAVGCATIEGIIDVDTPLPDTVYISPAVVDGNNDQLVLPLDLIPSEKIVIRGYRFTVANKRGTPQYILENSIPVPKPAAGKKVREQSVLLPRELVWGGKDFDGDFVPDGEYTYFVEAWDGLGNEGRSPDFTVIVDNTPPVCQLEAPYLLFSPNGDNRRDVLPLQHLNASAEEMWVGVLTDMEGTTVNQWEWENALTEVQEWDGTGIDGTIAADGSYSYTLASTDRAGNSFSTVLEGIQIDTRPSPIAVNIPDLNFSPNGDGVKDTLMVEPRMERKADIVSWEMEIIDETFSIRRKMVMEGMPPEFIAYDGRDDNDIVLPDGGYKAVLRVLYRNGNLPEAESALFTIDTVAPAIASLGTDSMLFSPDGDGNKDYITIQQNTTAEHLWTGTIIDSRNNPVTVWNWDGTAPEFQWYGRDTEGRILADGRYSYTLASMDPSGNRTERKIEQIVIDTRPTPVSLAMDNKFFSPNGDGTRDTIRVRPVLSVKEEISSWKMDIVDSSEKIVRSYTGKGAPPSMLDFDGVSGSGEKVPEGSYKASLMVNYLKGNVSTGVSPEFVCDVTPPVIKVGADLALFSPNNDGKKDSIQINQSGSGEELWLGVIRNSAGAEIWKKSWKGQPLSFTWDGKTSAGKTAPDGDYIYTVTSTDQAGNTTLVRTGAMTLDNRRTPVSITTDTRSFSPNGDGIKDSIVYNLSAASQSATANWFVTILDKDGKPRKTFTGDGLPPKTIEWNGQGSDNQVVEGDYRAELTVEYAKGDVSVQRTPATAYIDITPPSIVTNIGPVPFSPDGDGTNDVLSIDISLRDRSTVTGWQADILDPYRNLFKRFKGTEAAGKKVTWNGKNDSGELVQSAEDYVAVIRAEDALGNKATIQRSIPVDILVIKDGDKLRISISGIYFKPFTADYLDRRYIDSERVDKNISTLDRLGEKLKKYNDYTIRLEGHAARLLWNDPAKWRVEESETLVPLSQARAEAIKQALVERGISGGRMTTISLGGTQPVVPHSDVANRWKNRRVEFILVK